MIVAQKPHDEAERLQSLHRLNLLDTPLEQRFERITRMTRELLGVPIAAFNLIDAERQWFKSIQGLYGSENDRKESFCAHTILEDDLLVVDDATKDARFCNNPNVTGDPHVAFYVGCPVRAPDGRKIGSLCAIDTKVRDINEEQRAILRDLAGMVEAELKVAQLSKAQNDLLNELDLVNRLALIDPLTRLWNKNGILDILTREWAGATRKGEEMSLAVAQIDNFRLIGQKFGAAVPPLVLQDVAKEIMAAVRLEDSVGRLDEDLFLIIMPGCPFDKLHPALERIRIAVEKNPVHMNGVTALVTVSIGGTTDIPTSFSQATQLLRAAENGLDEAKRTRFNSIHIAEPGDIDILPRHSNHAGHA